MKRLIGLIALLLVNSANAGTFDKLLISPWTTQGNTQNYFGIIYFEASFQALPKDYLCNLKKTNPNQFQMVDQEGGSVVRMRNMRIPPSQQYAVALGSKRFQWNMSDAAYDLAKACINMNLAPIADTDYKNDSTTRAYSSNPFKANEYASIFASEMRKKAITPTWKHFPGYSKNSRSMDIYDYRYTKNYKYGFKENSVDYSSIEEIKINMEAFRNDNYDILMLNYGVFEKLGPIPVLFNKSVIDNARRLQPNSLLITDDVSFLKLNDEMILYLFENVDIFLFSDYNDSVKFNNDLERLRDQGKITTEQIKNKFNKIETWRNNKQRALIKSGYKN